MLTFEEGLEKCLRTMPVMSTEEVELDDAVGRYNAESVTSDINLPPFDRSAMDGFAVRAADIGFPPVTLKVVATIRAGIPPDIEIGQGQAAHIMTGAPVPAGADTVVMIEDTSYDEAQKAVEIRKPIRKGKNICLCGEDVRKESIVLEAGERITQQAVPLLASVGAARLRVFQRPKTAIVTTGSELVSISEKPAAGKIRNSNLHTLTTQLRNLGIEAENLGAVSDDEGKTRETIQKGFGHDVLIISGGVSMGKYDIVADVLTALGAETVFHKVAVKPGKPLLLAVKDGCTIFGLPGNPVSVFVSFRMFVRPSILKMMAARDPRPEFLPARLAANVKMGERLQLLPGTVRVEGEELAAKPVEFHGSGDMAGLGRCDCLIAVPIGKGEIKAGKMVKIYLFES